MQSWTRIRTPDANCNVEYRFRLKAWNRGAPNVFDLAGYELESALEAVALVNESLFPQRIMLHQFYSTTLQSECSRMGVRRGHLGHSVFPPDSDCHGLHPGSRMGLARSAR